MTDRERERVRTCPNCGGALTDRSCKLVCPNPNIYYVLNIAGFLQNIPIYNDVDEAIHSFAGQSI